MNEGVERYIEWKSWQGELFGKFDSLQARYYAAETGIVAKPGARVLEIGFGNGSFLSWVGNLGIEAFGVELNPILVDRARELLGKQYAFEDLNDDRLTAAAGTFSHIVAFDVIEHIRQEELPKFLERLRTLLAANGRVILRFPNGDSPFGRINQHGDPTHLNTIGSEKIRYFALQAGLAVEDIRAPRTLVLGVGFVRSLRRRLVVLGRFCVERAVGFLYFGGRTVPLDPNYTAVLTRADDRRRPQ